MRARLTCALLLMAAVFLAHGLSCAASDSGPAAADASGTTHLTVSADAAHHDGGATPDTASPAHSSGHGSPEQGSTGHGAWAHALMVCLAVVAGGVAMAALASWLSRRRAAPVREAHRRPVVPGPVRWTPPAPDLSRLCVLRV